MQTRLTACAIHCTIWIWILIVEHSLNVAFDGHFLRCTFIPQLFPHLPNFPVFAMILEYCFHTSICCRLTSAKASDVQWRMHISMTRTIPETEISPSKLSGCRARRTHQHQQHFFFLFFLLGSKTKNKNARRMPAIIGNSFAYELFCFFLRAVWCAQEFYF